MVPGLDRCWQKQPDTYKHSTTRQLNSLQLFIYFIRVYSKNESMVHWFVWAAAGSNAFPSSFLKNLSVQVPSAVIVDVRALTLSNECFKSKLLAMIFLVLTWNLTNWLVSWLLGLRNAMLMFVVNCLLSASIIKRTIFMQALYFPLDCELTSSGGYGVFQIWLINSLLFPSSAAFNSMPSVTWLLHQ